MMQFSSILTSLWLLSSGPEPDVPQKDTWSARQSWPIVVTGGARALGFDPVPASPHGALGTELRFVNRRLFSLQVGTDLGMFSQRNFAVGGSFDATLLPRLTAPFGLYGDLGLLLGGQMSRVPGTTYRAEDGQPLQAARAPWAVAARVGLGATLGYDFSSLTPVPLRVFVRYRQLAQTPFMPGNGLPVMGVADVSCGLAVSLGAWRTRR
ncbi:MAG: hypothetical protein ACRBN8_11310 [Nannocystales bacterium]